MKQYIAIWLLCTLGHRIHCQVICGDLGLFSPDAPFSGWPDPTCPGDSSLELIYDSFSRDLNLGIPFSRSDAAPPSNFDASRNTVFLAHGWLGDTDIGWMASSKDDLLASHDVNVVTVGWGGPGGAGNLNYFESASTTRTVGAETAKTMIWLASSGGSMADMHCAGHSLGAHVCGHTGRFAGTEGPSPGRITGLDPAGPNFASNSDRDVGIYRDCGDFVDIIHTDRTLGSTSEPGAGNFILGHQDFFPNYGTDQPGCETGVCSHNRATLLFQATVSNPSCFSAAEQCTSTDDFPGSCSPCIVCPTMGYEATPAGGMDNIYALPTGSLFPYC